MSAFMSVTDVAAQAAYPAFASPQVSLPFMPKRTTFVLEDADAGDGVVISFDGVNDHVALTVGFQLTYVCEGRSQKIWMKRKAAGVGTINVRVMAED